MCGQGFGLALLVALSVLAASEHHNRPACDYTKLKALDIHVSQIAGTWYRKLENYGLPGEENMLGYRSVITDRSDSEGEKMEIIVTKEFPDQCQSVSHSALCTVNRGVSHCVIDPNTNSNVSSYQGRIFELTPDNNIVVFESIVNMNNGYTFKFFDIFTRDPLKTVTENDLMPFSSKLIPACGEKVVDPNSDFYARSFTYNNRNSTCIVF